MGRENKGISDNHIRPSRPRKKDIENAYRLKTHHLFFSFLSMLTHFVGRVDLRTFLDILDAFDSIKDLLEAVRVFRKRYSCFSPLFYIEVFKSRKNFTSSLLQTLTTEGRKLPELQNLVNIFNQSIDRQTSRQKGLTPIAGSRPGLCLEAFQEFQLKLTTKKNRVRCSKQRVAECDRWNGQLSGETEVSSQSSN